MKTLRNMLFSLVSILAFSLSAGVDRADALSFDFSNCFGVYDEYGVLEEGAYYLPALCDVDATGTVTTVSHETIAVSGLPNGLSFDAANRRIYGRPTTPGLSIVSFTGRNESGFTFVQNLQVLVGAISSDHIKAWDDADDMPTGESLDWWTLEDLFVISYPSNEVKSVDLKGLPSGVTLAYDEEYDEYFFSGKPRDEGVYSLTCTVTFSNMKVETAKTFLTVGNNSVLCGTNFRPLQGHAVGDVVSRDDQQEIGFYDGDEQMGVRKITGLPPGMSATTVKRGNRTYYYLQGRFANAGVYKVSISATSMWGYEKVLARNVIVRDLPGVYVAVDVLDAEAAPGCAATGSGIYSIGSTARVTATADRDFSFAGWRDASGEPILFDGVDYRTKQMSFAVTSNLVVDMFADFVRKTDDLVDLSDLQGKTFDLDSEDIGGFQASFSAASGSLPTLTFKTLPAGVTCGPSSDAPAEYVLSWDPLTATRTPTPGRYRITCTAKNVSGNTDTAEFMIRVKNLTDPSIDVKDDYGVLTPKVEMEPISLSNAVDFAAGDTLTVAGLPTGTKYESAKHVLSGMPTKPGEYTLTFTAKIKATGETVKATAYITVKDFPKVTVELDKTLAAAGNKVSGAGNYEPGKKVTLKATAAKGYLFNGWYDAGSALCSQAASYAYTMGAADTNLVARFIASTNDWVGISCEDVRDEYVTGEEMEPIRVVLDCGSTPTVKATGLPSGVKLADNAIGGTPTKSGIYPVTLTVTTAGKLTATTDLKLIVRKSDEKIVDVGWNTAFGKVTGPGIYATGKTATLKATANKGYVLNGWYDGEILLSQATSYAYTVGATDKQLEARFIEIRDDWLEVDEQETVVFVKNAQAATDFIAGLVDSGSTPTISVKGLPAGLRFDAKTSLVTGKATKAAVGYMTLEVKNAGGYKFTRVVRYAVVENEGDPIPDDPELKNEADVDFSDLDGLETGMYCPLGEFGSRAFFVGPNPETGSEVASVKVAGLPAGLAASTSTDEGEAVVVVYGTPTKPGRFTVSVTVTYADRKSAKSEYAFTVEDGGSLWLDVLSFDETLGTATGSGVYASGEKVKITAKAAKNFVFTGWYEDSGLIFSGLQTMDGVDYRTASTSFIFRRDMFQFVDEPALFAEFIETATDKATLPTVVFEEGFEVWTINSAEDSSLEFWTTNSLSLPKLTVTGLPKGVTMDPVAGLFRYDSTFADKIVPGWYAVTVKANNQSKASATTTFEIFVENKVCDEIWGLDPAPDAYPLYVGLSLDPELIMPEVDLEDGWTLKQSGCPSGVKFVTDKEGAKVVGYHLEGVPSKAGSYTVTFTATKGRETAVATITLDVSALPIWAVGSFDGVYLDGGTNPVGSVNLSVTSAGKVSGKILKGGKSYAFSASSLGFFDAGEESFRAEVSIPWTSQNKEAFSIWFTKNVDEVGCADMASAAEVCCGLPKNEDEAHLVQNVWTARKDLNPLDFATGAKAPKASFGEIDFSFGAKGAVTFKGKVDAVAVTGGKSQVLAGFYDAESGCNAQMVVYVANAKLEGGAFCKVLALKVTDEDGDGKIDHVEICE